MFAFAYPAGAPAAAPALNVDPGRVRVEALFRALYGDCEKGTLAKTRKVPWVPKHGGGSVTFTTAQGADKALEAVSAELDQLPKSFSKYLVPSAGTYNCRAIADTNRMSMHAYAAAIDISTKQTTYWQWVKPGADGLCPGRTRSRLRSSPPSRSTVSSGAAAGITTTPCTSSTGRSCCPGGSARSVQHPSSAFTPFRHLLPQGARCAIATCC